MNVEIRKMTVEDIPAVVALDQMSFSLPWPERSFRFELTENQASRCWVAEADGRIVGMVVNWLLVDEAHVATIAVHPEFRRRGIARELLAYSLRFMMGEGAVSSFLEVRESNIAAREMYRKFGYENTGRRKAYYKDNNEDAILMTLEKINIERLAQDVRCEEKEKNVYERNSHQEVERKESGYCDPGAGICGTAPGGGLRRGGIPRDGRRSGLPKGWFP